MDDRTTTVIDGVTFEPDLEQLRKTLRVRERSGLAAELERQIAVARRLARPRVVYRLAFVDERGDGYVVLDGCRFESRVLSVNLAGTHRAVAYVATSGRELEDWALSQTDPLLRYWAEAINQAGVRAASAALVQRVTDEYGLGKVSSMNPGSLADWPLREQRSLFGLLGDVRGAIGVELTSSLVMVPTKSVSGILFSAEEGFASCQLCPRPSCPNRRAEYDPGLYARKYA